MADEHFPKLGSPRSSAPVGAVCPMGSSRTKNTKQGKAGVAAAAIMAAAESSPRHSRGSSFSESGGMTLAGRVSQNHSREHSQHGGEAAGQALSRALLSGRPGHSRQPSQAGGLLRTGT
jgi:hypothetical protein